MWQSSLQRCKYFQTVLLLDIIKYGILLLIISTFWSRHFSVPLLNSCYPLPSSCFISCFFSPSSHHPCLLLSLHLFRVSFSVSFLRHHQFFLIFLLNILRPSFGIYFTIIATDIITTTITAVVGIIIIIVITTTVTTIVICQFLMVLIRYSAASAALNTSPFVFSLPMMFYIFLKN